MSFETCSTLMSSTRGEKSMRAAEQSTCPPGSRVQGTTFFASHAGQGLDNCGRGPICRYAAMSRSTLPAPLSSGLSRTSFAATQPAPQQAAPPPSPPAHAGSALVAGRFEVLGLIGVGGMGSVYRARDV